MLIEATWYACQECMEVNDESAGVRLYECGRCSQRFSMNNSADGGSNRCPTCNIFAAKVAEDCCLSCEESEIEEVLVLICDECDEHFQTALDATNHMAEVHPASATELR